MATILCIETSTKACSLCIERNSEIVFERTDKTGMTHSTQLGVFAKEASEWLGNNGLEADAVAVSAGPGSYTGLRIGVATAKGLCFGWQIPIIAVDTLGLIASIAAKTTDNKSSVICPMIDARRMEVYTATYTTDGTQISVSSAEIITEEYMSDILKEKTVCFCGDGAAKCKSVLTSPHAEFIDGIEPVASDMAEIAENMYNNKEFQNLAYFDPFYVKDFQATQPKNKVI